ncbi:MAG: sulfite exporter TauE/SafE family protein [Polyangiaceae bacterium]
MSLAAAATGAFMLGLASAPHCLAMCGPLTLAGCSSGEGGVSRRRSLGYFGARFVSYALVGAVMGHLGASASVTGWDHVGRWAMVLLAIVCVYQGVATLRKRRVPLVQLRPKPAPPSVFTQLRKIVVGLLPRRGAGLGMVTALFPCGALVAAWGIAAASAEAVSGAVAMLVFAAASAPGLVIALVGRRLGDKLIQRLPAPVLAAAWFAVAATIAFRLYTAATTGGCPHHPG